MNSKKNHIEELDYIAVKHISPYVAIPFAAFINYVFLHFNSVFKTDFAYSDRIFPSYMLYLAYVCIKKIKERLDLI